MEFFISTKNIFTGRLHFNFTKGGVNYYKNSSDATPMDKNHFNKNREGYYGWFGYGGSIMQWHPELKIGFAFVNIYFKNLKKYIKQFFF